MKTLVNSGISTAASVPQLMIVASCHHRSGMAVTMAPAFTDRSLSSSQLMPNEVEMHRMDAIQIRRVSGCSKSNSVQSLVLLLGDRLVDEVRHAGHEVHQEAHGEDPDDELGLDVDCSGTASVMNAIRATPVTP